MDKKPTLEQFLTDNLEIVISGLEGSSKTRSVIKWAYEKTKFNNREIILISLKSYAMMKEKQIEIMNRFNLTEREVQIVGIKNEEYQEYYTNKDNPQHLYQEVKIVLCSQRFLSKCYHHLFDTEKPYNMRHFIKTVIVDEFDMSVGIIPSLHFLLQDYITDKAFGSKKMSKKDLITFLKRNYSQHDYYKIEGCEKSEMNQFFVSYWIEYNKTNKIRTIFCTSEILARTLLEEVGFNSLDMEYKKFDHNVHFCTAPINNQFFNRLNSLNKWNVFGFNTIISDKCNQTLLQENEVDLKVINHTSARGSNLFAGEDILTILSYIPQEAIRRITEVLKYFNKNTDYKIEIVEKLFYRDRICQAVGRVIGYRGEWKEKKNTWLMINTKLWHSISEALYDDKFKFPYNLIKWNPQNKELDEIIKAVLEDGRISNDENKSMFQKKREVRLNEFNNKLNEIFVKDETSDLSYEEVTEQINKLNLFYTMQPVKVANYFGCEIKSSSKRINGKIVGIRKIIGLKVKGQ